MNIRASEGRQRRSFLRDLYSKIREMRIPNRDVITECHSGKMMVRNPHQSMIGRSIYMTGLWEPVETEFISSRVKPGMTILDVGADIGYYTLLFAQRVGPSGRVLAFEPIPKAKCYLDQNIALNGWDNVQTFDFALFDRAGTVCLEDPFRKSRINPSKAMASDNDIQIEMQVFDEWRRTGQVDRVDLIKLDVEGAEMNVLRGMADTLQSHHPAIFLELHPREVESFSFSPSDVLQFLSKLGYRIVPIGQSTINLSQPEQIHLFCE